MTAEQAVGAYKALAQVERAFRSLKTVDLEIRPVYHRLAARVRAHVFLCMLAYYVEFHMRQRLLRDLATPPRRWKWNWRGFGRAEAHT